MGNSSPVLWILWSHTKGPYFNFLPSIPSVIFLNCLFFFMQLMKWLNSLHLFLFIIFSISYFSLFAMIKLFHTSHLATLEAYTFNVSLPKFSFTSLTHTAGFSHYNTNKFTNDILGCQSTCTFSLLLLIFLGIRCISLYENVSSLALGDTTLILFSSASLDFLSRIFFLGSLHY